MHNYLSKRILDVTHLKIEFKKGKIFFDKVYLAHFLWLKAFAQPETTADLKLFFSAFLFLSWFLTRFKIHQYYQFY